MQTMLYKEGSHLAAQLTALYLFLDTDDKLDILFGLGASGRDGSNVFEFEKEIVKHVIGLPKTAKTRYALIDYHNGSKILINFDDFKDEDRLKNQVNLITWQGSGNDFENLLRKAKDVFQISRKSRKVLMIFINDRLNTDLNVIRSSVRMLNSLGLKVIVVRIGDRVNNQEVSAISSSTIVRSRTTDDVARTGDLAGSATLKGRLNLFIISLRQAFRRHVYTTM